MVKQNDKWEIDVFLSLGTNLGNRELNLRQAIRYLGKLTPFPLVLSSVYESEAWGNSDLQSFLNMAVGLRINLSLLELLRETQRIESCMGRSKKTVSDNYENRLIDVDILLCGEEVYKSKELTVPHALMHERMFVLKPLVEIASAVLFPPTSDTILQLYEKCTDNMSCNRLGVL